MCEVTFKEIVKLPEVAGRGEVKGEKVKTVKMTEDEFEEFLQHKAFKQEKIQKKLKKKALVKRLRKSNLDLEREVKKAGVKRKIISDSSDDGEDPDKTLTMEVDNNNPDVIKEIDSFLASSSEETAPLVSDNSNWMHMAKRLNREERESVSKRFSEELRLLSSLGTAVDHSAATAPVAD